MAFSVWRHRLACPKEDSQKLQLWPSMERSTIALILLFDCNKIGTDLETQLLKYSINARIWRLEITQTALSENDPNHTILLLVNRLLQHIFIYRESNPDEPIGGSGNQIWALGALWGPPGPPKGPFGPETSPFGGPEECRRGPLRGPSARYGCVPPRHTVWKCFGRQTAHLKMWSLQLHFQNQVPVHLQGVGAMSKVLPTKEALYFHVLRVVCLHTHILLIGEIWETHTFCWLGRSWKNCCIREAASMKTQDTTWVTGSDPNTLLWNQSYKLSAVVP